LTPSQGRGVTRQVQERRIHQIFVVSVVAKGLHALIEIAGGLALYLFSADSIGRWVDHIDPHEWVARHLDLGEQRFFAFYLLSHGLIKAVLVVGLLRQKLWAYPASVGVFGLFIAYQLYRYSWTHDVALIALSIFDLFVIALAIHEYRLLRKHLPTH
jgi:uncharacterized membrane protein